MHVSRCTQLPEDTGVFVSESTGETGGVGSPVMEPCLPPVCVSCLAGPRPLQTVSHR